MNKKSFIIAAILLLAALAIWLLYEKGAEVKEPENLNGSVINEDGSQELASSTEDIQNIVSQYLRKNISDLSPEEPVLGGNWYTTKIDFLQGNKGMVYYEDGHIAREASFSYVADGDSVAIFNFYATPEEADEPAGDDTLENSTSTEIAPILEEGASSGESESSLGQEEVEPVFCTMDAMMCPDGSYVGRVAPNCDFAQCPNAN